MIGLRNKQSETLVVFAESVTIAEESRSNPVFLSVDVKMCDSEGNDNREGVTAEFIHDVVAHQEVYNALPFYADTGKLLARKYQELTHLYNKKERKFGTNQIGSLCDFREETDEDGKVSLMATIRVPKRESEICDRLIELYDLKMFSVSFEVKYSQKDTHKEGNVLMIEASENNHLSGLCLVSVPACRDAVALDLVAEANVPEAEATGERGEKEMDIIENVDTTEVVEAVAEEIKPEDDDGKEPIIPEQPDPEGGDDEDTNPEGEGGGDSGDATSELIHHEMTISHEYHAGCEECGTPATEITRTVETVVETVEEEKPANAEVDYAAKCKDLEAKLKDLEAKCKELEAVEKKYNEMVEEAEKRERAARAEKAKAFAEKQGLNPEEEAVAQAIAELDFEKLAGMTMARKEEEKPESGDKVTVASFCDVEMSGNEYGGLLKRKGR